MTDDYRGAPEADAQTTGCEGHEVFALRVLGDDMLPEFAEGEIIIIEPGGACRDGSYVLAQCDGQWWFRQLRQEAGSWLLRALNPACQQAPVLQLDSLAAVRGVVIQKAVPGRRRDSRFYI